jgi:hypothetical protein
MRSRDEISAGLAVEWLENFLEEAKKMEKQQIIDACDYGIKLYINDPITSEDYYNETYGGNKMDDAKSMMSESQPSCLGAVNGSFPYSIYEEELNKIKQLPQTQTSLMKQCEILRIFANKLGLYDAADFLRNDR